MVEAPGTAPGSVTLIPHSVYRHSRLPDNLNIVRRQVHWKGEGGWFRSMGLGPVAWTANPC
jgi:hypothetical protein